MQAILDKVEADMSVRLTAEGKPVNPGNDYELHLYARSLRLAGKDRQEVRQALFDTRLPGIPLNKRASYVADILQSVIVGFPDNTGEP